LSWGLLDVGERDGVAGRSHLHKNVCVVFWTPYQKFLDLPLLFIYHMINIITILYYNIVIRVKYF